MVESVIAVDELPLDVAVHPRTGERFNYEQIYIQQRALEAKIASLGKMVKAHEKVMTRAPNPLGLAIRREKKPADCTVPHFEQYYGDTCPVAYLSRYEASMNSNGMNDNMKALNFSSGLYGEASDWWNSLPDNSIQTYDDLSCLFINRF